MATYPGLPDYLYQQIRKVLGKCPETDSDADWRAQFSTAELSPYELDIPNADSKRQRIETTIPKLEKYVPHAFPLLILLEFLANKRDPKHPLKALLQECADNLQEYYQQFENATPVPSKFEPALQVRRTEPLNPQLSTGDISIPPTEAHERILECASSVALVEVMRFENGVRTSDVAASGTAWMIAPRVAMTCWHVLAVRSEREATPSQQDLQLQIANTRLRFDFKGFGKGVEYGIEPEICSPQDMDGLDYVLLRLKDRNDHPLKHYNYLLWDCEMPYASGKELYCIQHPLGHEQKDSPGRLVGELTKGSSRFLHSIPTDNGSSGAPVMNTTNWRVCGLHCGEQMVDPKAKLAIKMDAIRNDIQERDPRLYDLIQKAQNMVTHH